MAPLACAIRLRVSGSVCVRTFSPIITPRTTRRAASTPIRSKNSLPPPVSKRRLFCGKRSLSVSGWDGELSDIVGFLGLEKPEDRRRRRAVDIKDVFSRFPQPGRSRFLNHPDIVGVNFKKHEAPSKLGSGGPDSARTRKGVHDNIPFEGVVLDHFLGQFKGKGRRMGR